MTAKDVEKALENEKKKRMIIAQNEFMCCGLNMEYMFKNLILTWKGQNIGQQPFTIIQCTTISMHNISPWILWEFCDLYYFLER